MTGRQAVIRFCVYYLNKRNLPPTLTNMDSALFAIADAFPGDSVENAYLERVSPFAWTRLYRDINQAARDALAPESADDAT